MRTRTSAVLPASTHRVWAVLLDWEAQARWMRDADRVEVLTPQREGVGVRVAVRTRVLNVPPFTEVLEVVEWDPPRRLRIAHRSFVRGFGDWVLEPTGARTRFTWTEDLSLPPPVLGEIALRVYRPFMRRLMRGAMRDLASYLAGSASDAT